MQYLLKIYYRSFAASLLLFMTLSLKAQTPLSSQNFAATNYFNPASVGFGVNNQFNSFYRTQFAGVGDAYKTIGVGADFKIFHYEKEAPNNFGMGINAVSEKVLNGVLQSNYITVSFANRIFLNKLQTSYLALGIGATLISRNIDREQLTFSDQFNSGRLFNSTSVENIAAYPVRFTTNVGLMYGFSSEDMYLQLGASSYYINRTATNQSYNYINQSFQMVGLINFEHRIWEDKSILVHADYQNRWEAEYYYTGLAMGFPIHDKNERKDRFYLGCFYRSKDAIIPYIGLMLQKYKIGISYDVYQNNMTTANLHPQTFEFSLSTYLSKWKSENLTSLFN